LEHSEELTEFLSLLTLIFENGWRTCLKIFFIYLITLFDKFKAMQIVHGEICHELGILFIYLSTRTIVINNGIVQLISIKIKIILIKRTLTRYCCLLFVKVTLEESSLLSTLTHRNRIMTISMESVCGGVKRSGAWHWV
jgi:hypothetical protein